MAVIQKPTVQETQKQQRERTLHDELVQRGLRWLKSHARCKIAFPELATIAGEIPDGWGYGPQGSVLIECKASRADFLADAKKYYRRNPMEGMGNLRYFLCPPALIKAEELPESWGLLYCHPRQIKVIVKACSQKANLVAERKFLASVVRRCALRWPIDQIQDYKTIGAEVAA